MNKQQITRCLAAWRAAEADKEVRAAGAAWRAADRHVKRAIESKTTDTTLRHLQTAYVYYVNARMYQNARAILSARIGVKP